MARVSDEEVTRELEYPHTGTLEIHGPYFEALLGDLRDARALLREALGSMAAALEEGEVIGYLAEGSLTVSCNRIRQHLEGHNEQH